MIILGVDEVGRGAIAGPVYAAAVILPQNFDTTLTDSKKLSSAKRYKLDQLIRDQAVDWSIGSASVLEIEQHNILGASLLAMKRAIERIGASFNQICIDGLHQPELNIPDNVQVKTLVKGDVICPAISAASIIAKVARDRYMAVLDKYYKHYQFSKHKGYPTHLHIECLDEYGVSGIHRRGFKPIKSRLA